MYDHSSGIIGRAMWASPADVAAARSEEQAAFEHQRSASPPDAIPSPILELTNRLMAMVQQLELTACGLTATVDRLVGSQPDPMAEAHIDDVHEDAAIPRLNYLLDRLGNAGHRIGMEAGRLLRTVG